MRFLLKLILLLILALPLVAAGLIYLALDSAPGIDRAAEITPANIARAKRILDQNDPRKLKPGVRRTIFISQSDLDLAANYLARQYAAGGARIQLQRGMAKIGASVKLPVMPLPIYLNLDTTLAETGGLPRIESLRLGQLPMPASLAHWLISRTFAFVFADTDMRYFRSVVKKVDFTPSRAALTYEWQADLPDRLRTVLLPAKEQNRLRAYQERLAAVTGSLNTNDVSLTELLAPLFALAADRSTDDAVAENRAAILLLTLYVNGQGIEKFVPEAKNWPPPAQHRVLLNGRDDFPKHFIVSAALAAKAGAPLADAVGVYKELADARGGSGFSFNDIAADRAGTRFGEYAAAPASARRLQQRLRAGIRERDIMPETADLPEFMPEAEFLRRFGGVDAPAYKKMMAKIERRIAALPLSP